MDIIETIKEQIANNPILLYMKGSPNAPQCGFSSRAAQVLMACGEKFAYVDILQNPEIRANLPKYANWPTFPQLWVNGELVGGQSQRLIRASDEEPRLVRGFFFVRRNQQGNREPPCRKSILARVAWLASISSPWPGWSSAT